MNSVHSNLERHVVLALMVLALLYAAVAGLRTVADPDLGWQLATGRYVVEHRQIPYTDVFSYTAEGQEWIYPPFSGVLFYGVYSLGGFAALSWLGVAASAGTLALLLRGAGMSTCRERIGTAALAVVAAPAIAVRTLPRANLFTTVLFAAFLSLLWQHYRRGRAPLWLLPPLMLAWVNLHLGFIAGLAALGAYVALELLELPFAERRAQARMRLRRGAPWLAATVAATLVNPWGPRIYAAIARQNRIQQIHSDFVSEWVGLHLSGAVVSDALDWRNPWSAYWWLLAAVLLAFALSAWRKQPGIALLLGGAALFSFRHVRFHGLFAIVAVIVAGSALAQFDPAARRWRRPGFQAAFELALLSGMLLLAGVRMADLVSDRYYLSAGEISSFGAGAAWWYPERAAAFLLRERLPGRVINDYNLGGYLIWCLGPDYPVYVDGRAVPFGADLWVRHRALMQSPPDSAEWQREAERRGINTVIVSVARYPGKDNIAFCNSQAWRPVYLDEVAAIFVRNRPENAPWLERLQIDCATVRFAPPASRNVAELYNFYANSGAVLAALGRHAEALDALERAQRIFPHDPYLYLMKGSVLQAGNRNGEAEQAYRTALRLRPGDQAWYALGHALAAQGRYPEAVEMIARAARYSPFPYDMYRMLGEVYLAMNQPQNALRVFDQAEKSSPYRGPTMPLATGFRVQVAAGRARAWRRLGDLPRAVSFQELAVQDAPGDPAGWLALAELYDAQGRAESAQQARSRAESLKPQ